MELLNYILEHIQFLMLVSFICFTLSHFRN